MWVQRSNKLLLISTSNPMKHNPAILPELESPFPCNVLVHVPLHWKISFQLSGRIKNPPQDQANYDLNEVAYFDVNEDERADFSGS